MIFKENQKIILSFLAFAMVLFVSSFLFAGNNILIKAYADMTKISGGGVEGNSYLISNADELKLMGENLSAYYKLVTDIDLGGEEWTPIGNSKTPFTGNFDGDNYEIINLKINTPNSYKGLFSVTKDAVVSNVTLCDVMINGEEDYVGALIGNAGGNSTITNCHVRDSKIYGQSYVGGLIGQISDGTVSKCSSTAYVQDSNRETGGIIGYISGYLTMKDCYVVADVVGKDYIGGLVGYSYFTSTKIINCYSASKLNRMEGNTFKNLKGIYNISATITNSYYDNNVSCVNTSGARTTAQMMTKDNFVNWDFDNIWSIDEGSSYPYFKDIDKPEKEEFFYIRTKEDLESMRENKFINYKLMNDIDLEGEEWTPIGTIEKPFEGKFYGSGYTISNFKINNESDNQGLFGCTKDLKVNHLKLSNVTINGAKDNVGAIVGNALGKTDIVYCNVENSTISGQSSVGGLAGRVEDGICAMCLSDASITGTVKNVGGFIGKIDGTFRVENCKAISEICGRENVAGLIGYTDFPKTTIIVNNYSLSKLTKIEEGLSDTFGGLYNGTATVLSSYYVSDIWDNSALNDDKWSKSLDEMYDKDTFVNWDFNNIWSMRGENVTPYLKIKTKIPGNTDETVSGILIEDQDGLVTIPGATVNARKESQDGEIEKTVTTDSEGIFRFDSLGIGKYVLEISAEDYITRYFEFDNEKGKDLGDITVKHILD